jgi:hypothetical protein
MKPGLAKKLIRLTGAFEGGWLAGDFDGQIISWGALQWNLGQGTLQGVLRRIYQLDPVGTQLAMGTSYCAALKTDQDLERFARAEILNGGKEPGKSWSEKFSKLSRLEAAAQAMAEAAQPYLNGAEKLAKACRIDSERGLALCFDIATQNGAPRNTHIFEYKRDLEEFKVKYHVKRRWYEILEWQRLKVLAVAVADLANPRWRQDVLDRKLTVALGKGVVHGQNYDIEKDFGISYFRLWRA